MNMSRARWLADIWGTQFADVGRCGYINVEAGYGPWRSGERLLAGLVHHPYRPPFETGAIASWLAPDHSELFEI
jgi:hypothetical protein